MEWQRIYRTKYPRSDYPIIYSYAEKNKVVKSMSRATEFSEVEQTDRKTDKQTDEQADENVLNDLAIVGTP